jgi:transcriptional regulator with XRE-family HTH domain
MRLSSPADLGAVVRAARRKLGLSQQELAERSGMSRQSLVALEQGTANPTWDTVLRVSGVLGMNLSASLGAVPAESNHRPLPKRRPVRSARLADADREDDVVMAKRGVGDELMVVVEAQPSGTPLSTRSSDSKPVKPVNLDALLSDYDRA